MPVVRTRLIHLCHLPLEVHFLLGRHLLVYPLHISLMLCQKASKEVLAILMGAFLSALSSIWSLSVHGVGILTSSAPPSANCSCRMHLFTTSPLLTKGYPSTRVASLAPCLIATQHFFQLIHQALKDGQCSLAPEVIYHPAMLAILHLCRLFSLPIDFCCFDHVCLR